MQPHPDSGGSNTGQVQVSMEQLVNILLGSVNSLHESMTQLRTENDNLRAQSRTEIDSVNIRMSELHQDNIALRADFKDKTGQLILLQQNSGVLFPLSSKLPAELRRIIWQHACRAPQTHVFRESAASFSKINSIINSCKEARAAAAALQLDYLVVSTRVYYTWQTVHGTIKNYVNFEMDTIWLSDHNHGVLMFPKDIEFKCGKCQAAGTQKCEDAGHPSRVLYYGSSLVRRLAINHTSWSMAKRQYQFSFVGTLKDFGVQELLIVVGDVDHHEVNTDVVFVKPPGMPKDTAHAIIDVENRGFSAYKVTWASLEKEAHESLRMLQHEYLQNILSDEDESDTADEESAAFWQEAKNWIIPKIRYVQPMKTSQGWLLPPPERKE